MNLRFTRVDESSANSLYFLVPIWNNRLFFFEINSEDNDKSIKIAIVIFNRQFLQLS